LVGAGALLVLKNTAKSTCPNSERSPGRYAKIKLNKHMPEEKKEIPKMTPEEIKKAQEDLVNRTKYFNGELTGLLAKYKLGLVALPFIAQDGRVAAQIQVFNDQKVEEKKSDIIEA